MTKKKIHQPTDRGDMPTKDTEGELLTAALLSKLQNVTLTKTEAQDMRERLISYTNFYTANSESPATLSPGFRAQTFPVNAFSLAQLFNLRRTNKQLIAAALLVLILVSTTGVSYAAEDTLPGQPLYEVKVALVEPIQGALITSTVGKANWQNELTERRLTEAATLAAQNKLSSSTQEYLAQAVTTHVDLAQQDANQLAASGDDTSALSVRSDLEARLSAHADFLALIAPKLSADGDATTTSAVVALLNTVETDSSQVAQSEISTEVALGDTDASSTEPTASTTALALNIIPGASGPTPAADDVPMTSGSVVSEEPATVTPAVGAAIAYVNSQNSEQTAEEQTLLLQSSALFRLLPNATTTASTTASTTIESVSTTTDATSTPKYPFYKLHASHLPDDASQ